jgi:hypothetical protein
MNSLPRSLSEIRARAAAIFAQDDGIAAVSLQTFLGLVYVNTSLEIIDHADAVRRGLTDPIN